MLLARQGHRVLLVDRATFPSDTVSTLVIHARGVAALRRWRLLDKVVASGCPPIETYSFDFGAVHPFRHTTARGWIVDRVRPTSHRARQDPPRRRGRRRRRSARAIHGRRDRDRGRGRRRCARSRRRRVSCVRAGRSSRRSRWTQLAGGRSCRGLPVPREANAQLAVLRVLERVAGRRLRDVRPPRPRRGGDPDKRRADAADRRVALRRGHDVQG